ncbi:MAG: hypothetical protein KQI62_00245 [Deltaproteobacteria bacterium]|nr:hypothetical protein [Deltaproteobacteria bacterium]
MRYYGKEGPQCKLTIEEECSGVEKCRKAAHAVLFGRVPRGVVLWLGLGLMFTVITMGLWGLTALSGGNRPFVQDMGSAIRIHR